jgi:hypothetical protein
LLIASTADRGLVLGRRCARALGDVAAVEAIAGVVDCRTDGQDARGLVVALLFDACSSRQLVASLVAAFGG